MCDMCLRPVCPIGCPNHRTPVGKRVIGVCADCGREILDGDVYFRLRKGLLCDDCVERTDVESLIALQGLCGIRALLLALGAEWEGRL